MPVGQRDGLVPLWHRSLAEVLMGSALPLGNSLEGPAGLQSCSSPPSFPQLSKEHHTLKWFWRLNVLSVLHVHLFSFTINELVRDHGFKKPVEAKVGGCLPLVLGCWTGPCVTVVLSHGVTVSLTFILLSVFKRRKHRDCSFISFIPLVIFQIHGFPQPSGTPHLH